VWSGAARVIALEHRTPDSLPPGLDAVFREPPDGLFESTDLFVVSPGLPSTHPWIQSAKEAGVAIVGELALAASHLTCPLIAITGTNGKSTVTTLAAQVASQAGLRVFEGGNLGVPLSDAVLDGDSWDVAVVEVSSYQMEWPGEFKPSAGVVLNVTPDHLARHGDMETYAATKMRIFDRMDADGSPLLPGGQETLRTHYRGRAPLAWMGSGPGVELIGDDACLTWHRREPARVSLNGLALQGEHNRWNMAVALWLVGTLGVTQRMLVNSVPQVRGLAHRMESLVEREGVLWINDSKATNVEAAEVAIRGVERSCVVLLGGEAKGPGYTRLLKHLTRHRAVVAFGGSRALVVSELAACSVPMFSETTLEEAVLRARTLAAPGDGVLLTPGGASFDAFRNFEHRGEVFRHLVEGA
jgi:UDP-N-acetylmuramoylalanine--D-glutamate ligase